MDKSFYGRRFTIALGADHQGFKLKEKIKEELQWHKILDYGTKSEKLVDYPLIAKKVAKAVQTNIADRGILICLTGIGMSIAANKIPKVRAALCSSRWQAELSRKHNDSNILVLSAREKDWKEILTSWLETEFDGNRHKRRIEQIAKLEKF